jgi:arylsulfatase A-like enzyme
MDFFMNKQKQPNIIWIFSDQQPAYTLGCNGDPNSNTPNLDLMAGTGWNFNKAVSGFPICCPFRGALISGKYPHKCVPGHEYRLSPELPTVADAFNDAGYETAYFGKWHLAGFKESEGRVAKKIIPKECRGRFDTWLAYENNNQQYDTWFHGHDRSGKEVPLTRLPGYETDKLTDLLLDFIESQSCGNPDKPFFSVLSVQPPHNPYEAPPEYLAKYKHSEIKLRPNVIHNEKIRAEIKQNLAGVYAMIENIDHNVGRVRNLLREKGIDQDTYIIFFSDHGDMHGSHGQFQKTIPYEESIRVPFIISGGDHYRYFDHRHESRQDALINHVDIAPTSLGLCGIEVPEWMEGCDYSSCITGRKAVQDEPREAYLQNVIPTGHPHSCDAPYRGIVTRDGWKYVCTEASEWLLFNLNEDPYEERNLAMTTTALSKRHELHAKLQNWIDKTKDNFSLPPVYEYPG